MFSDRSSSALFKLAVFSNMFGMRRPASHSTQDMIVFDTAPTGHTLKLLELPKILQVGLDRLESWQATLWGYWEAIKGIASGGS